jgi:hypothetical protein
MRNRTLVQMLVASAVLVVACGRDALIPPSGSAGEAGSSGGSAGSSSGGSAGASSGGSGGSSSGGAGGTIFLSLPDGGISALIGDSGILGGILDAPRDSLIGQMICGPEARLGAPCSTATPGCVLPSLGGACACLGGTYVCPINTSQGPTACPKGAATGGSCLSIMSVCIGGGANACVCAGTYTCF